MVGNKIVTREDVIVGRTVKYYPSKNCPDYMTKTGVIRGYYDTFDKYFQVIVQFGTDIVKQGVDPDCLEYID